MVVALPKDRKFNTYKAIKNFALQSTKNSKNSLHAIPMHNIKWDFIDNWCLLQLLIVGMVDTTMLSKPAIIPGLIELLPCMDKSEKYPNGLALCAQSHTNQQYTELLLLSTLFHAMTHLHEPISIPSPSVLASIFQTPLSRWSSPVNMDHSGFYPQINILE